MAKALTVYFDGACPLCRREIGWYRRRPGSEAISWIDVSQSSPEALGPDLCEQAAMARFHVRLADGRLVSGAGAFGELWKHLPGLRMLGGLARMPLVEPFLEGAYRAFLRARPGIQKLLPAECESDDPGYPRWLERELRSDHAGETGAVAIYRGILAVSRDASVRQFAERHLQTEARHLQLMEQLLPRKRRSRLLMLWRLAGFITGALPAFFGPRAVYVTIDAVETFVDRHYSAQIEALACRPEQQALRKVLEGCRADELEHRDEARNSMNRNPGAIARAWTRIVALGSTAGVAVARLLQSRNTDGVDLIALASELTLRARRLAPQDGIDQLAEADRLDRLAHRAAESQLQLSHQTLRRRVGLSDLQLSIEQQHRGCHALRSAARVRQFL